MAMNKEFMGFLDPMRVIEGKGLGRIRVLGMKESKQWRALDDETVKDKVGGTCRVFLTYLEDSWLLEYGQLVRFKIQENDKENEEEEGHDRYIVKKYPSPPIKQLGAFLLPYDGELDRESIQLALEGLAENHTQIKWDYAFKFYLLKEGMEFPQLVGPFENLPSEGGVQKEEYTKVFSFSSLEDNIIECEDTLCIINFPSEVTQVVDLSTNERRATWLRSKLKKISEHPDILEKLDELGSGWKNKFKKILEGQKKADIALDLVRWSDSLEILDHVVFEHGELMGLKEKPAFKKIVEHAIEKEREGLLKPARDYFEKEKTKLDQHIANLLKKQKKLTTDVNKKEKDKNKLNAEIALIQQRLEESQEEDFRQFVRYRKLFEGSQSQSKPQQISTAPSESKTPPKLHDLGILTNLIDDSLPFVTKRLAPIAQKWDTRIAEINARQLHLALLTCKMVLLPCAAMIRAYHEALGEASVYRVITVKPTWLSFDEAWKDGIDEVWQLAQQHSDRIFLLYLQDMDRALPEIWLRPILDLASGIRESLPTVSGPWPENLRLVFTKAMDQGTLPMTPFTSAHFAHLKLGSRRATTKSEANPGNVSAETWKAWAKTKASHETPDFPEAFPVEVRRMAGEEWQRLAGIASQHDIDEPGEVAEDLRLKLPTEDRS